MLPARGALVRPRRLDEAACFLLNEPYDDAPHAARAAAAAVRGTGNGDDAEKVAEVEEEEEERGERGGWRRLGGGGAADSSSGRCRSAGGADDAALYDAEGRDIGGEPKAGGGSDVEGGGRKEEPSARPPSFCFKPRRLCCPSVRPPARPSVAVAVCLEASCRSLQGREVTRQSVYRCPLPRQASSTACELPSARSRQTRTRCAVRSLGLSFRVSLVLPFSLASRPSVVAGVGCRAELFGLTRAWMASSSVGRGDTNALSPPDRLAVFYKLVAKKVIASVLSRHARAVELSAEAATQAEALFADDSLVVASLRMDGNQSLNSIAIRAIGAEGETYAHQSWALLLSAIPILQRRLESNTLLPGTIREEEMAYNAHEQAVCLKAKNKPVPSPAVLRAWASTMGYNTLLDVMFRGLDFLPCPWWPAAQRRSVQSFVLQGLDAIPLTAGVAHTIAHEAHVVAKIERRMNPRDYDPAFCAAVLR